MIKEDKTIIFLITFLTLLMITLNIFITNSAIFEFQPNSTEGKDTYIRENSGVNFGDQNLLRVGKIASGLDHRSLIEHQINISSENTIIDAKLQLYVNYSSGSSSRTVKLYRITSNWSESEANWTSKNSSDSWTSAGGDYAEEVGYLVITNSSGVYYNFTITSIVRKWVNGTYKNYGLILISNDSQNGNFTDFASSDSENEDQRPKIIVEYVENAAPTITNFSTDSSPISPKRIGENVTFNVTWEDLESNLAKLFVCNSSAINFSGCTEKTFCQTPLQYSPSSCSYTVLQTDKRETTFYLAVCDSGSQNCSSINSSYFYMNHLPSVLVIQPNGGETINQSLGNYTIKFNVSDEDSDYLKANLYYGPTQYSTTNLIATNLNLTQYCTDLDGTTSTTNNCSYSWNTTGIYGDYYLTIILNDSFSTSNDSSDNIFYVRSLIDNTPPEILAQWISDSDISSGKLIQFFANVSDPNINTVWVSINTTPQINLTMRNSTSLTYNTSWIATSIGNYSFKVYANDTLDNINSLMPWESFTIRKPIANSINETSAPIALPFSLIKISSVLNATDQLRGVYAYLNTPPGFTFLSDYPQNSSIGNFSQNEAKTINWIVSVPLEEANYTLNITYYDGYGNNWSSSNFYIAVTSFVGGGYFLTVSGYPEVSTGSSYFTRAFFTRSGSYTSPDSIFISIYDSTGNLVLGPASMTETSTGIYFYNYSIGASANEGQWETIVNATKSSLSYYAREFWKVIGGPFDLKNIEVIDPSIPSLNISVVAENTGGANKDLILIWNLTIAENNTQLDSGAETFMVNANSQKTWYISPQTSYLGQVKITFLGYYSGTEKIGAYKTFTTILENITCGDGYCSPGESCYTCPYDCGTCPPAPGGGGGIETIVKITKLNLTIKIEKNITIPKNMEKIIYLEVNNTGDKTLEMIMLDIEGIPKEFFKISPLRIGPLKTGEAKRFEIKFLVRDYTGKWDINFILKTKEGLTEKESAELTILSLEEYFLREILTLKNRLENLKSKSQEKIFLDELQKCTDKVNKLELDVKKEDFLEAEKDLKEAKSCIDILEKKEIKPEKKEEIPEIKVNWEFFIILFLMILILLIIFIALYILYRKLRIINFIKRKEAEKEGRKEKTEEDNFNEKIENIKKLLGLETEEKTKEEKID